MPSIFHDEQKAVITLPPRNDTETEMFSEWNFQGESLNFEGQEFIFPQGFHAGAKARWLEDELLLCEIGVDAVIEAECARCLKAVSLEISGKLMYLYQSHNPEAIDDDDEYMPVEVEHFGRVLDVMPQVQESIYTLLPTKVLCSEDCKGLCPNCGADLNEGECSCKNEDIDPRLWALRNFTTTTEVE